MTQDYSSRDHRVWEDIFAAIPREWYAAPPSDAMRRCAAFFADQTCRRVMDVGCGFGRWTQSVVGAGSTEVVGVDYAEHGIRAAAAWAFQDGANARFLVASAMALPFRGRPFDGVLAALLLDNLSRPDCLTAVRGLNAITQIGARGFFVFNPVAAEEERTTIPDDDPTKGCMHVVYEEAELPACLPGWSIERVSCTAEGFRVVEATFQD